MNEKTKNALLSIVASLVCIVIGLLVGRSGWIYTNHQRRLLLKAEGNRK